MEIKMSMKIFLIIIFIALDIAYGQFGIKAGVALSGYQPSQNISTGPTTTIDLFLDMKLSGFRMMQVLPTLVYN